MKVRKDFVSNSSSSSFIIAKTDIFTFFKIGKETVREAIASLWTGDAIDADEADESKKPYCVFEMPKDRAKAIRAFGQLLENWNQHLPYLPNTWSPDREDIEAYESLLESLSRASSDWYFFNGDEEDLAHSNAPEHIKQTVKDAREKLGIKKADEVLLDDSTQLFIHFDDNELLNIKGIDEEGESCKFETQPFTCERFIEILFNWLVDSKKIDLRDPEMLKLYPIDECHKRIDSSKVSCLENDTYTWKDFFEEGIVHAVFHEG